MQRRLPPLNAIRAFEAAARSESFARAAEELCVTPGAVGHQVKALEAALGVRLFEREKQRLRLSAAGRDYLATVRDALDRIALGTACLLRREEAGVLTVSTSPDFAAKWLVHRLGAFAAAHPGIDLRISAVARAVDFAREEVDVAVRHGDGHWPGLHAAPLGPERLFPVCSPHVAAGLASPSDLLCAPLLRLDDGRGWARWFEAAGLREPVPRGPVLDRASLLIDAAADGQGVALARTTLAAWDLRQGRLVRPFALSLPTANGFWVVCPGATAERRKIAAFRAWIVGEAAEDARRLDPDGPAPA